MNDTLSVHQQLQKIINEKKIYPVYQPIVSLKDGSILGYEALTRISLDSCSFNIEEMFCYAEQYHCLWELDYICRKEAIKHIQHDIGQKKLFLNVDPNTLNDSRFQSGMTFTYLDRYHLSPDNIVFEICERTNIQTIETFQNAVSHYEQQNYQIAIDDFGKGYAGFNRIFFLHPRYVKLDLSLIRDIDHDSAKRSLIDGLVKLCHAENICLIAEGIETEAELTELIQSGIDYGQGYFLGKPDKQLQLVPDSVLATIASENKMIPVEDTHPTFFGNSCNEQPGLKSHHV